MNKSEIRKLYKLKREELSAAEMESASKAISDIFFKGFDLKKIKSLNLFLPIKNKKELNTWHIVEKLRKEFPKIKIIVPKVDPSDPVLNSYVLKATTALKENSWGIPEPVNADKFPNNKIDMALVPLLAVDKNGNRVGYGKGFYDRFFSGCKPEIIKVGLSFFDPIDSIEDLNQFDVPLDHCITPVKKYSFNV